MKITKVETIWISIPFDHGGPASGFGGKVWRDLGTLLVKVETDEGITGWGEAFGYNAIPSTRAAIESMVAPLVIGRDPLAIAPLMTELQKTLHIFGRYGQTIYALSGLDIALWDIAAKAAGVPLRRLLGTGGDDPLPCYASLLRYGDPAVVAERSAAAAAEGYRHIKLHETTVEAVAAARDAVGPDVEIMVDTNCPWTLQEAIDMARRLEPQRLYWLEEPIWPPENFAGLAELSRRAPMPIAAGENACTAWQFQAILEARAVAFAQPSVTKVGGITEFRKVQALCETHNTACAPHSPYFGPGFLATMHLVAGTNTPVERFFGNLEASLYGDLVDTRNGQLRLPEVPGVGPEPDPDVIARYKVQ